MGLETSIYSVLSGNATVATLVSDRIHPETGYPHGSANQITYSGTDDPVYSSTGKVAINRSRFSVVCYGTEKEIADSLFNAVIAAFETTAAPKTFGDIWVQALRRTHGDSESTGLELTSANVPDFYVRHLEYFSVWQ